MVFSSISFLTFFLPCLFACYFVIPRKFRSARNGVLLVFSLVFYACGGPKFLLLMLLSDRGELYLRSVCICAAYETGQAGRHDVRNHNRHRSFRIL